MESLMQVGNSSVQNPTSNYVTPPSSCDNSLTTSPEHSLNAVTIPSINTVCSLPIIDTPPTPMDTYTLECLTDVTVNLVNGVWSKKFGSEVDQVVPLAKFILETVKRSKVTLGVWSLGLLYLLRLNPKGACFEKPSFMDFARCGRRMFMASLMVASKFTQDKNYKNRTWANIMGVSVAEVNCIEMTFLKLIDYQLLIPESIFNRWETFLKNQISSHRPKVGSFEIKSTQKPAQCPRYSPYKVKSFSARCKSPVHGSMVDRQHENRSLVEKRKTQCSLSFLLNSPPKESLSSPEIPNTLNMIPHPHPHPNNGYLTP
ncbi:PHO85 cyclin-5 [Basidiobolus ranarum]|uniref:PHO85 cyclin-5 n=1 Tax=Basidiobolus ranarum TaxID=34480 RepID=A0ABR2WB42_9FUNG